MTAEVTAHVNPARYSPSIVAALADLIPAHIPAGHTVHDPFAGEGTRLGKLCDQLGYQFTGTDLEVWLDHDPRVGQGNSTHPGTYPSVAYAVVTSPTYGNGINDHWTPRDKSNRRTYRIAAGHGLDDENTGRWSGRGSKVAEARYWSITDRCVDCWPGTVLVNVKDSYRGPHYYPLVDLWVELLERHGYTAADIVEPAVRGYTQGSVKSRDRRVEVEAIIVAKKISTTAGEAHA